MGLLNFLKNKSTTQQPNTGYKIEIVTERGSGFYSWRGGIYKSDIVRSCVRPRARATGKMIAKHIRQTSDGPVTNPEPYIRFLLEEPNPYMTGQMFQEKMSTQLQLNNNAFALIVRDENGYPFQMYPIPCTQAESIYDTQGNLLIKFQLKNGKSSTFHYSDLIHLRLDYNDNDVFGDPPAEILTSLMEIVNTIDQGIVKAILNSNVIKWLLKFNQTLRPEDIDKHVKMFVKNYLTIDSDSGGAAAHDSKFDVKQVEPKSYVPNAAQMDRTTERVYSFFNTNEKIIKSDYSEDDWIAYYEAVLEPDAMQFSGEYTRKLFSRKERGFGNKIIFESSNLAYASMKTKLQLKEMVDRGAMTPNEWRAVMHKAPLPGGDKPLRRLDTAVVDDREGGDNNG